MDVMNVGNRFALLFVLCLHLMTLGTIGISSSHPDLEITDVMDIKMILVLFSITGGLTVNLVALVG